MSRPSARTPCSNGVTVHADDLVTRPTATPIRPEYIKLEPYGQSHMSVCLWVYIMTPRCCSLCMPAPHACKLPRHALCTSSAFVCNCTCLSLLCVLKRDLDSVIASQGSMLSQRTPVLHMFCPCSRLVCRDAQVPDQLAPESSMHSHCSGVTFFAIPRRHHLLKLHSALHVVLKDVCCCAD